MYSSIPLSFINLDLVLDRDLGGDGLDAGRLDRVLRRLEQDGGLTATPSTSTPSLVTLSLSPSIVTAGAKSTGTVKLSASAPVGGTVVALSSGESSRATVPGTVTVPAGKLSAGFIVSTTTSATKASVAITATLGAVTKTRTLVIRRSR